MTARLRHVSKKYRRKLVLHDVTLDVGRGEVVGLIGPNGAGKTTLLRIVSGLVRSTSGHVVLDFRASPTTLRYFGGDHTLPGDVSTHRWKALWGIAAGHVAAGQMRLLSPGTRQRVGLEATLRLPAPSLVVLDEPWEGLDPDASRWLSDELLTLSQQGSSVIVSSHRIHDLAEVCTRCAFLVLGRVVSEVVLCPDRESSIARSARLFEAFDRSRVSL